MQHVEFKFILLCHYGGNIVWFLGNILMEYPDIYLNSTMTFLIHKLGHYFA
jgi:hypothetical protein